MIYAFAGVGLSLPHFTGYQYNQGQRISPQEMERGDLIFYGPSGNHHVAIYLGDGMMLEAPQSGQTVTKSPVRWSGMSDYAVRLPYNSRTDKSVSTTHAVLTHIQL